jgi:hypothetical protein
MYRRWHEIGLSTTKRLMQTTSNFFASFNHSGFACGRSSTDLGRRHRSRPGVLNHTSYLGHDCVRSCAVSCKAIPDQSRSRASVGRETTRDCLSTSAYILMSDHSSVLLSRVFCNAKAPLNAKVTSTPHVHSLTSAHDWIM